MAIAPDPTDTPDAWPVVEVTGQFDHPAAMTCRNQLNQPDMDVPEPDPDTPILNCRDWFKKKKKKTRRSSNRCCRRTSC